MLILKLLIIAMHLMSELLINNNKEFYKMKLQIIMIVFALITFGFPSMRDTKMNEDNRQKWGILLNLSKDQTVQFQNIVQKFQDEVNTLRSNNNNSKWKIRRVIKKLRKQRDKDVKELLSKDQYDRYLKELSILRERRRESMRDRYKTGMRR
tara:strand:+ start:3892 stop:4347 length:456 start_codon:yes stop_codon:yes gene_type:complete